MPREKSRYRDRRSSSYSSESSYERKRSKSKHKRRSRSRDRSESSSHKRKRSTSRSKHKRRSYTRSLSRDRYESKSRRRSSSRSRSKRDRSRSLSSSRSKSKYSKKKSKRSRSSSSRSSSFDIERPPHTKKVNLDDTETKLEKAIKAAAAAGLTMTKIPTYEYKEVEIKEDMPTIHDRNLLAELNSDSFVPKAFTSSRNKKQSQSIVIDLNSQTVTVPETDIKVPNDDSVINFDEIPSEEELKEMWIQKLYHYRKKMIRGEL
ncbi:serine/arginine-rich splicing factor 4 [Helicoverpa zea]|uniref:serine/arginine-rich splicing factor 4 n=1 Tax=Helicoverpa zea TaxID=7113 RepID=UPI001F58DF28|nr:serine/arginine-rich splicing factor 4 [Helicoverpa zea]